MARTVQPMLVVDLCNPVLDGVRLGWGRCHRDALHSWRIDAAGQTPAVDGAARDRAHVAFFSLLPQATVVFTAQ